VPRIDLNCDLGEGAGHDHELMPLVTSANIACGAHAGNIATMRATVALALHHGASIGAHPGFADPEHFGRRERVLSGDELALLVTRQVAALCGLGPVRHVKPHGALYHLAARDPAIAKTIATATHAVDSTLVLYALAGSELVEAGRACGLRVAEEVFADRTYRADGTLTPRTEANAFVADETAAATQVLRMVKEGVVRTTDGVDLPIVADTVCLHGDGPHAVTFARILRQRLEAEGVEVRAIGG
jgi:UPF0271 protein